MTDLAAFAALATLPIIFGAMSVFAMLTMGFLIIRLVRIFGGFFYE